MQGTFRGLLLSAALWAVAAVPAMAQGAIVRAERTVAPARISTPTPRYPDELRRARIEGTVLVEARIDSTGQVEPGSLRIVESPDSRFDEAAKEFVVNSRYRAGRANGKKVAAVVRVPVMFDLHGWR